MTDITAAGGMLAGPSRIDPGITWRTRMPRSVPERYA